MVEKQTSSSSDTQSSIQRQFCPPGVIRKADEHTKKFAERMDSYPKHPDLKDKSIDSHISLAAYECCLDLISEMAWMADKRKCHRTEAIVAIAKQQIQKWKAIHRRVGISTVKEDAFKNILLIKIPDLKGFI